jgi:MYXO-CTERM domain-containing protein
VNQGEGENNVMMDTATIRVICGLLAVLLLALVILRRRQRQQQ